MDNGYDCDHLATPKPCRNDLGQRLRHFTVRTLGPFVLSGEQSRRNRIGPVGYQSPAANADLEKCVFC